MRLSISKFDEPFNGPRLGEVTMNSNLEQEVSQLHAEICAGLADPTRILILYWLADGPHNVAQLADSLDLSQPTVSRHLKVLRERGMVGAVRLGTVVEYRLADRRLIQALDLLRAVLRDNLTHRAELAGMMAAS
jgi:DNA-binding transcriptional ArsR family regulator